jgi:hypothetical protein
MCFGGGDGGAADRAAAEQLRVNQLARQRQDELNRIASAREAAAAAQAAEMARLQQSQDRAIAEQQARARAASEQGARLSSDMAAASARQAQDLAAARASQEESISRMRSLQDAEIATQSLNSQAVSQSMRVLANQNQQLKGPSAQLTRRAQKPTARANSAENDLKIGSSGVGAGVGVNLGG